MEKITIPDELMAELKRQQDEIASAKAGLNHFSVILKEKQKDMWQTIYRAFPELDGWILRFDLQEKTLTKLHKPKD